MARGRVNAHDLILKLLNAHNILLCSVCKSFLSDIYVPATTLYVPEPAPSGPDKTFKLVR